MVWYSHIFKNFSWFVVIHTVKGFSIVNEARVDFFLKFSCLKFFCDPTDVNFISGSSPFLNSACTSGSSWFTYYWSLAWRILSMTLLACEMSAIVWQFEHSLALFLIKKQIKRCLISFLLKVLLNKIAIRCDFTSTRLARLTGQSVSLDIIQGNGNTFW